jgi:hypothetical protein
MTLFVYSECGGKREADPVANALRNRCLCLHTVSGLLAQYAGDVPHFHKLYCIATDSMSLTAGTWNETRGVLPLHKVFAINCCIDQVGTELRWTRESREQHMQR